jgi:hypothetical protein
MSLLPSVPGDFGRPEAGEAVLDDLLGLGHDPVDQLLAGRNGADQSRDDASAPGTAIHLVILEYAAIARTAGFRPAVSMVRTPLLTIASVIRVLIGVRLARVRRARRLAAVALVGARHSEFEKSTCQVRK